MNEQPAPVVPLDPEAPATAAALVALQRQAYGVAAALIGHGGIPQLTKTLAGLRRAGLTWCGVREGGDPVAAVAWSCEDGVLDIARLVVRPDRFRRGLARRLLASLPPAAVAVVSTGAANTPARRLYADLGFVHDEDVEAGPGLWVSRMRRVGPPPAG